MPWREGGVTLQLQGTKKITKTKPQDASHRAPFLMILLLTLEVAIVDRSLRIL